MQGGNTQSQELRIKVQNEISGSQAEKSRELATISEGESPMALENERMMTKYSAAKSQANSVISSPNLYGGKLKTNGSSF